MLADLTPGTDETRFGSYAQVGRDVFFTASMGFNSSNLELWKTNGTAAGTVLVKDIRPGSGSSSPRYLTNVNGTLFFAANDGVNGMRLWKSDGTTDGTQLVSARAINPESLFNVNGSLFFTAIGTGIGRELWKSDGTSAGSVVVKDIHAGNSLGQFLGNLQGTLLFEANDGVNGYAIWRSDGTAEGTVMVKDLRASANFQEIRDPVEMNGEIYFSALHADNTYGLWKSDGTADGTIVLKEFVDDSSAARPAWLTNVNGTLMFTSFDGSIEHDLWKSDGTSAGTVLVKDLHIDNIGSPQPKDLTAIGGTLYFVARVASSVVEHAYINKVWKSDGTAAGTVVVETPREISVGNNSPQDFTNLNGVLYFTAYDQIDSRSIWRSDGTLAGTFSVVDLRDGPGGGNPFGLRNFNGTLFFQANDGIHGSELWLGGRLNSPPVGEDNTVTQQDWAPHVVTQEDLGFEDTRNVPPDSLSAVIITSVPDATTGQLLSPAGVVAAGQRIEASTIVNGQLRLQPVPNAVGTQTAAFQFQVEDNGGIVGGRSNLDATANTFTLVVSGAENAPRASGDAFTVLEDTLLTVMAPGVLSNDAGGGDLSALLDTLPFPGKLTLSQIGGFAYSPPADFFGTVSFSYQASDGVSTSNVARVTLTVEPVNDPPRGTDRTITLLEDTAYTLQTTDFGFSDAKDNFANELLSVRVESVPERGVLMLDGVAVAPGSMVTAEHLASGFVHYVPPANGVGSNLAQLTFRVRDDGGTANGGTDLAESANTITFNVTQVNDPPSGTDREVTIPANGSFLFSVDTFGLQDPFDTSPNIFLGVRIVELPTVGSLTLNGVAVSPQQLISRSQVSSGLRYTPPADQLGSPLARLTFQVQDAGGTANGGANFDPTPNVLTFNVTPQNHLAVVNLSTSIAILEGHEFVLQGDFTDPDAGDSWTATVDFGDGSGEHPLAIGGDKRFAATGTYVDNGTFTVRVRVRDSSGAIGEATTSFVVLNSAPAGLMLAGPESVRLGRAAVFSAVFIDAGASDTFTASFDWGDGTSSPAAARWNGAQWQAEAAHVYAAVGTYLVTVRVEDDDGGMAVQTRSLTIANNIGTTLQNGVLNLVGSPLRDDISVTLSGGRIVVNARYGPTGSSMSFPRASVQRIMADLSAGNDALRVDSRLRIQLVVDAGSGNDRVNVGGGPSLVVGGYGSGMLTGGSSRDVLIGGGGRDQLLGNGGSDLLISGRTTYDSDWQALAAVFAEWTSGRSLSARVNNLRTSNGPILSGLAVHLKPFSTVIPDGQVDSLMGEGDLDWFLYEPGKDSLRAIMRGEPVN